MLALIAVLVGLSSSVFPILRSYSDFQSLQILPAWICIPGTRNHNCQSPQQLGEPTIAIHRLVADSTFDTYDLPLCSPVYAA